MKDHIYLTRNGKEVKIIDETPLIIVGECEGKQREYSKIYLNDSEDPNYDLMERLTGKDKRRG